MTLYVINPNSTEAVTTGIDRAIAPFRSWGHPIKTVTLADGPPGIETDQQVADVVAPLATLMDGFEDASGFVITCFSDPGVHAFRSRLAVPVIGIREAAVAASITLGSRFGVIAVGEASVRRHLIAFDRMGVSQRLAGDRALGLSVVDLTDPEICLERMIDIGRRLRDDDGADVLIMGCAGMAQYRNAISDETDLPVIEPCQAAVASALGRIRLSTDEQKGNAMLDESAKGVFTIAATPFLPDGALDRDSLYSMVDFYLEKGATGLTILGMMGEAGKLTADESTEIIERVCARATVPVVVGVSAPGFAAMEALTSTAMDKGAAGVMVAPPGSLRTDREIVGYYRTVAERFGDVPWVLQDFPLVTGVKIEPDLILQIASDCPSCVMLKHEDWPGLEKISALRAASDKGARRISILCGNGGLFLLEEMMRDADGAMTGFAFPEMMADVVRLMNANDETAARDLFDAYLPMVRYESQPGLGLAIRKYILAQRGAIAHPTVRAPGPKLTDATIAEVEALIARQERRLAEL